VQVHQINRYYFALLPTSVGAGVQLAKHVMNTMWTAQELQDMGVTTQRERKKMESSLLIS